MALGCKQERAAFDMCSPLPRSCRRKKKHRKVTFPLDGNVGFHVVSDISATLPYLNEDVRANRKARPNALPLLCEEPSSVPWNNLLFESKDTREKPITALIKQLLPRLPPKSDFKRHFPTVKSVPSSCCDALLREQFFTHTNQGEEKKQARSIRLGS